VQLIVVSNKESDEILGAGFCYEHTPAEGPPIVKLMEHTVKHLATFQPSLQTNQIKTDIEELKLVPDTNRPKVLASAQFSIDKYSRLINSLDLEVLEFKGYGKDYIKDVKYSPDSWIQVAINFAFYRLHGRLGACYESASTRKFAFGRTDTIRSVTNELSDFFKSPNYQTLNNAIESHKNVVKNALNGNGIDRVLLGNKITLYLVLKLKFLS
jgi:carnitine O-acetyltransferase